MDCGACFGQGGESKRASVTGTLLGLFFSRSSRRCFLMTAENMDKEEIVCFLDGGFEEEDDFVEEKNEEREREDDDDGTDLEKTDGLLSV